MDRVPFLFVNAVLHCLNSESLSAPRLLDHPLWSSVAEEHHRKRKDYVFWLCNPYADMYHVLMGQLDGPQYVTPEEWLRSDKTHLRIRKVYFSSPQWRNTPHRTFEEAVQCSRKMIPYLNDLKEIIVSIPLEDENKGWDFLWKRTCHTLNYNADVRETSVIRWQLENNDRLERINSYLFSYDEVSDLLPLCIEKRITWRMKFFLLRLMLRRLKAWQGEAQWDDIYPELPTKTVLGPPKPKQGRAFYEDEHIRKEFVWFSRNRTSFTITWK
uniref:Mab-21 domain-containing protein n=1 Tax=Steinernema glaseri TaxID=37863 RepID=A0A1I7Z1B4_9BILA